MQEELMKNTRTLAVVLLLCTIFCGYAMADRAVNATPETQGITTATMVICEGTVTHSASGVWQQSSEQMGDLPLSAGESMYIMSYTQDMIADQGYTEFTDQKALDTAAKVANQNNFESTTMLDFIGGPTGYVDYEESTLIDGAGTSSSGSDSLICPFGAASVDTIPAFCNIVEMGGSFSGSKVTLISEVEERHVAASADVPVTLGYEFTVRDAEGRAAGWMNAHLMEGRGTNTLPSADIIYNERTDAAGTIGTFYKRFTYDSGVRRA
jgi:hypothetical protein